MSQDSIGVVTTGRGKLQEWKTTQKQNLSRKSRGTLTVKWAGSRDKIFSVSGRGRTFFLTSLFIELIDWVVGVPLCKQPSPVLGTLCAISISPIARYEFFVQLASEPYSEGVLRITRQPVSLKGTSRSSPTVQRLLGKQYRTRYRFTNPHCVV